MAGGASDGSPKGRHKLQQELGLCPDQHLSSSSTSFGGNEQQVLQHQTNNIKSAGALQATTSQHRSLSTVAHVPPLRPAASLSHCRHAANQAWEMNLVKAGTAALPG